jgi:hypothetical protein
LYRSDFQGAQRFVPANAKIPVTIKMEHCSFGGAGAVDVAAAMTISVDGSTFDLPISASNVPVQTVQTQSRNPNDAFRGIPGFGYPGYR